MKALAINDSCYFVDIIDECLKELLQEAPPVEELVAPTVLDIEKAEVEVLLDEGLDQCLALTPNPMPNVDNPKVELKELPKTLRYELLDYEFNHPVIVNASL